MTGLVTRARRREFWLAFLALAFVLAAGLGLRDPWPADEPRFALVAKQMVDTGEYLFPHRGIELYSDKPPTYMWSQALAYHATGSWRVAFLLPSLLAALGTLLLVYDLARRLWSRRAALLAMLALGASVHFAFQSKAAQIDPTIVFWITLSGYALLRHVLLGPAWRWYALAWIAAGIGIITKGVGFLALLMIVPYAWARWRGYHALPPIPARDLRWYALPVLVVVPVLAWLVPMVLAMQASGDPALVAYAGDILLRQTAERYANPWHHVKPFWYYGPVIALMWMPLALALPWAVPAWRRRIAARADARVFIPLAFVLLVVVFFSLSPGKRDVYILPGLPMLCVAAAGILPGLHARRGVQRSVFAVAAAIAALLVGLSLAALLGEPKFAAELEAERAIEPWWLTLTIGGAGLVAAGIFRARRGALVWASLFATLWTLYGFWGYPLLNDSRSARGVMARAAALVPPGDELALVAYKEQNLLHAPPGVTEFGFLRGFDEQRALGLAWLAERPGRRWLFILGDAMGRCIDRERAVHVGNANRRAWYLLRHDAVIEGCVDTEDHGRNLPTEGDGD